MPLLTASDYLRSRWTPSNVTDKLIHTKVVETPNFDKYVKDRKGQIGANFTIKIYKGPGVVLESVDATDEHIVYDRGEYYEIEAKTARYPLSNPITPDQLDELNNYKGDDLRLSVAEAIGEIQREHKEAFDIALEHQTTGAMFNNVTDGKGKVLFKINYTGLTAEFKSGKKLKDSINEVFRHIKKELGVQEVQVEAKCSPAFMDGIYALAKEEKLFDTKQAKEDATNGTNVLEIHGMTFIEYLASCPNQDGEEIDYISEGEAVFIPTNARNFKLRFSRASDTKAAGSKPKLYFGAVEEIAKGRGWDVRSECRPLVYNSRPAATPKGKFISA